MTPNHLQKSLRILILEDVPTDAELMEQELRSAGIDFVSARVETRVSFLEALDHFSPDIILSDYSLPGFDGKSALSLARAKTPQVPFIFVTGALGEERAVELLKSGATDFVLKDRLIRLPLGVKRAQDELEEKRRRQLAEEKLRQAHADLEWKVKELERTTETLRLLSSKLLSAQEDERKRIASEIHDSLGASLSAAKFKVETVARQLGEETPPVVETLNTIIPVIQEGIEECRRIQMDLRPPMIDDLGLLATLAWFCRRFQKIYSKIEVRQEIAIEENELPASLKIVIYRVTQEAMNNIAKHSKADHVRLGLRKLAGRVEVVWEDNGRGFDAGKVLSAESTKRGLGLTSMRERAELSGGSLAIESAEGKGTTIRASWPFRGPSGTLLTKLTFPAP